MRSPSLIATPAQSALTPSPSAMTRPLISWPGIVPLRPPNSPRQMCTSEPQTLVCVTSATTPPAGGAGTSYSWKSILWAAGIKALRPFMLDAPAAFDVTDLSLLAPILAHNWPPAHEVVEPNRPSGELIGF